MPQGVAGTRIWYQSFTDPDADRSYFSRLEAYLGSVASQGCQVEVFGIRPGQNTSTLRGQRPGIVTGLPALDLGIPAAAWAHRSQEATSTRSRPQADSGTIWLPQD